MLRPSGSATLIQNVSTIKFIARTFCQARNYQSSFNCLVRMRHLAANFNCWREPRSVLANHQPQKQKGPREGPFRFQEAALGCVGPVERRYFSLLECQIGFECNSNVTYATCDFFLLHAKF
jgi:hypothetical protein